MCSSRCDTLCQQTSQAGLAHILISACCSAFFLQLEIQRDTEVGEIMNVPDAPFMDFSMPSKEGKDDPDKVFPFIRSFFRTRPSNLPDLLAHLQLHAPCLVRFHLPDNKYIEVSSTPWLLAVLSRFPRVSAGALDVSDRF
jgi:hypothetical protein